MKELPAAHWLLSDAVIERLGWTLLHSLWQFSGLALLAGLTVLALRRRSAELRYNLLAAILSLSIICPLVTWLVVPNDSPAETVRLARPKQEAGNMLPTVPSMPTGEAPSLRHSIDEQPLPNLAVAVVDAESPSVQPSKTSFWFSWAERTVAILRPWLAWVVGIWCFGVMICSLRPLLGCWTLRRLSSVGASAVSADVQAAFERVSERLQIRQTVRIMQSTLTHVPIVIGFLHPVILLPISFSAGIPLSQLEAILAHELAHVRRHDFLVNVLQTLVETLFFYHPGIWWLSRQIRREREHCCDDLVVASLGNRVEYGRALLAVEELRGPRPVLALGAADGSLLHRIRRLAGLDADRMTDRWSPALLGVTFLGIVYLMSAVSSRANDKLENAGPARKDGIKANENFLPDAPWGQKTTTVQGPFTVQIVIAEHVMLWEGRTIVTWEEVERMLAAYRDLSLIHPNFLFTSGAIRLGLLDTRKREKIFPMTHRNRKRKLDRLSIGTLSPRAGVRFDRIRTADDLKPNEADQIEGRVLNADGLPVADVEVVLITPLPQETPVHDVHLTHGQISNPLEEVTTRTDLEGRFRLYPPQGESFLLIATHSDAGFALVRKADFLESSDVRLGEWSEVTCEIPRDTDEQYILLKAHIPASDKLPEVSLHLNSGVEPELDSPGPAVVSHVPFGLEVGVNRTILHMEDHLIPEVRVNLVKGESRRVELGAVSEEHLQHLKLVKKVNRIKSILNHKSRSARQEKNSSQLEPPAERPNVATTIDGRRLPLPDVIQKFLHFSAEAGDCQRFGGVNGWRSTKCTSMIAKCALIPRLGRSVLVPTRVRNDQKLARKVSNSTYVRSRDSSASIGVSSELPDQAAFRSRTNSSTARGALGDRICRKPQCLTISSITSA